MFVINSAALMGAILWISVLYCHALPYNTRLSLAEKVEHQPAALLQRLAGTYKVVTGRRQKSRSRKAALQKMARWGGRLLHRSFDGTIKSPSVDAELWPPISSTVRRDIESRQRGTNESFHFSSEAPLTGIIQNCVTDMAYSFDDGPYLWHQDMTDVFDRHQAKYTSFVNGQNFGCLFEPANVEALQRSYKEGHLIASHTWSHAHLNSLSPSQIDMEIERLEEALWKILGVVPAILRPPYGECNEACAHYLNQRHGLTVVTWDVDSGDSAGATPEQCEQKLSSLPFLSPHMPLSHETYEHSATDIPNRLLPLFKKRGYEMQTVDKCLGISPYKVVGFPQTRDSTWTCS